MTAARMAPPWTLTAVGTVALAAATLAPSGAAAQVSDDGAGYAAAGLLVSRIWGPSPATGIGAEATYMEYASRESRWPLGGFLQFQFLTDGSFRAALGIQAAYTVAGGELGLAYRSRASTAPTGIGTFGLHLGGFASIGVLSLTLRYTLPFSTGLDRPGWEGALVGALKFPYRVHGPVPTLLDR